jgi:tRNA(Ile)-lysidine synthase
MLELLKHYNRDKKLFATGDRILLAISGGIDSMVMLHLLNQLNILTGVAHCNFQLRGSESDEDALFVQTSAEMLGLPFYLAKFETEAYAEENHISIQMAARELRYTWFENIRKSNDYTYIATAHNADDSAETFFINLSRGCGLDGLTGIRQKSGSIIRPLLFANRNEITEYARRKGISFREDSSNATDKYLRNFIRHNVLPVLDEAHSNFRKGIQTTLQNLVNNQLVYDYFIEKTREDLIESVNETVCIDIYKLQQLPQTSVFLWELLNPYNFNRDTCFEIASSLEAQPGKVFLSPTHRLIKDRTQLILTRLPKQENPVFYLEPDNIPEGTPFDIEFTVSDWHEHALINKDRNTAMFDLKLLEWPLVLRKWRAGDYFAPLGMENLKKVSDFLIDQKVSLYEKENTWVLESGSRICWIVGKRIDHRFRVTDATKKVLTINSTLTH